MENTQPKSQEGTGSAENKQGKRNEQQNTDTELTPQQRQQTADEIGESTDKIGDIRETGNLSGRDDASGGSGDRMENENTGERTDR
jgi:hypothetical protein